MIFLVTTPAFSGGAVLGAGRQQVPLPSRFGGEDEQKGLVMTSVLSAPAATSVDLGPAVALSCRECDNRIELGPYYACTECFGPLEVAYEFAGGVGSIGNARDARQLDEGGQAFVLDFRDDGTIVRIVRFFQIKRLHDSEQGGA